jgi:hypothetical protein
MPSLEPTTYDALLYTSIAVGGVASISAFSVWWFSTFWRIVIVSTLAGVIAISILSVLLMTLYVKKQNNVQTGVAKRTAGTTLLTSANNKVVPGSAYKLQITGDVPIFLTLTKMNEQLYQLSTTEDSNLATQFLFESVGQVNELTIRPSIYYYICTMINGTKYYATTVQIDKPLDMYTPAEVNDPFLYFRPRTSSSDPAIRDTQFRLWPYNQLPEFKWETDRTYEIKQTDEIYLSFYKYIKMNQGCTLYQASINYLHSQYSLFLLV